MPTTHRVVMRSVVTSEDGTSMVHEAVDRHVGRTTQELGDTNGR